MSHADRESTARNLALALASTLEPALGFSASVEEIQAARDAAQVVMLPGLDRSLAACASHAGAPWPEEILPLVERLRRLVHESVSGGSLEPMVAADGELGALAAEVESIEWSESSGTVLGGAVVATLGLGDVLEDLAVPANGTRESLDRVRLIPPVAAALRAALDWLTNDGHGPHPVEVLVEDSSLTLTFEGIVGAGLRPAENVIADVGGSLGPVESGETPGDGDPAFMVRVPRHVARPSYLMLLQGDLRLAIPWHAVLKIRMRPGPDPGAERAGREVAHPVLPRIAASTQSIAEQPMVLVAHGLKRAFLCADRLVWRLQATGFETERIAPFEGLSRAVRTEDGEAYWLAEPRWLLAGIDLPWQEPAPEAAPANLPLRVLTRENVEPLGPVLAVVQAGARSVLALPLEPGSIGEGATEDVVAGEGTVFTQETAAETTSVAIDAGAFAETTASAAASPEDPALSVGPVGTIEIAPVSGALATGRRRVLIAEDSITARIFLGRMLQQLGAEVEGTGRAAELVQAMEEHDWWAFLLDVELPDSHGQSDLEALVARLRDHSPRAHLVALVRDDSDRRLAVAAGIDRFLLKPFDLHSVDRLMADLSDADNPVP